MLSGSISGLDKEVFVKALNELLMRLPLSLQSASDRLHTSQVHPSSVQIVYDYSLSSCNLLFGILVANFKSIRSAHDFNACWLRFLSVLAANGSMLVRGSPIHNEVLDVISALLRVLRVPKTFAAISKRHSQQPQESQNGKDSMYSGESQQGSGWLSWWIGTPPPIQSTVSSNNVVSPAPVNVQPSLPIQQQDKVSNNVAPDGPDDTPIVSVSSGEEEDADLLTVSWKTICSIYSSFPAHLRIKYPTLVLEIAQFVDWLDRGSAKASVSTSSSVDEVTNTEPRIDRLTMSVVSKESVNDMPSPSSSMTPTSSTSSNGRIQVV